MSNPNHFFEIHHAGAERALREVAEIIKTKMPPGFGFGVFIFEFSTDEEPGGSMFWLSNAQRPTMIKALREWIAKNQ